MDGNTLNELQERLGGGLTLEHVQMPLCEDTVLPGVWNGQAVQVLLTGPAEPELLERRRHAPGPPCPPLLRLESLDGSWALVSALPQGTSLAEIDPPVAYNDCLTLLRRVGAAIDQLHRFRLAHGALTDASIFLENHSVWIAGVGCRWEGSPPSQEQPAGTANSPRMVDLLCFHSMCARWLSGRAELPEAARQRLSDGIPGARKTTALSWLTDLQAAPETSAAPQSSDELPDTPADLPNLLQQSSPRVELLAGITEEVREVADWPRSRLLRLLALLCVVSVCGTFLTYRYRRNPVAQELLQQVWQKVFSDEEPEKQWLPQPAPTPQAEALGPEEIADRLERESWIEGLRLLFCEDQPGYAEALARLLHSPDKELHGFIRSTFDFPVYTWRYDALPRVRQLLAQGDWLPTELGTRTLDRILLRLGGEEDVPVMRRLLTAQNPHSRLDAHKSLARLEKPASIQELADAIAHAEPEQLLDFLLLAVRHYPYEQSRPLLVSSLIDSQGCPKPEFFGLVREHPSPAAFALLEETLPALVDQGARSSQDAKLLKALLCLQQVRRLQPNTLIASLTLTDKQREHLRKALVQELLFGVDPLASSPGWLTPDDWYAAALHWSGSVPEEYIQQRVEFRPQAWPFGLALRSQSLILVLVGVDDPASRKRLRQRFAEALTTPDLWTNERPIESAAMVLVLASFGSETAPFLGELFGASYAHQSPMLWEAAVIGMSLAADVNESLLERATCHPIPNVSWRARELSALRAGNVAAFRGAEPMSAIGAGELQKVVEQLEQTTTASEALVVLSRLRDPGLADLALPLAHSPGSRELLVQRLAQHRQELQTRYTLALMGAPHESREAELLFQNERPRTVMEQFELIAIELHGTRDRVPAFRWIATTQNAGMNSAPLYHRYLAVRALGALGETPATFLDLLRQDPSPLVRQAAALALLRTAGPEHDEQLQQFLAEENLPATVRRPLELALQR